MAGKTLRQQVEASLLLEEEQLPLEAQMIPLQVQAMPLRVLMLPGLLPLAAWSCGGWRERRPSRYPGL